MNTLDAALHYLSKGFSVIPLEPRSKKALIPWKEFQERKPREKEVRAWFTDSNLNIGIVTGPVSGLSVLDVDKPEAFNREMPPAPTVKTSRGKHLYFKHNGTRTLKLSYGDLKGDGGYVLAPPSVHPDGTSYQQDIGFDVPLPELPGDLIAPQRLQKVRPTMGDLGGWHRRVKAFSQRCEEGAGHDTVLALAREGGGFAPHLDFRRVEDVLVEASHRNGLLRRDGEIKVKADIKDGYEHGALSPFEVWPRLTQLGTPEKSHPGTSKNGAGPAAANLTR